MTRPQRSINRQLALLLLVTVAPLGPAARAAELHGPWLSTRTSSFELYSNAPADQTAAFTSRLLELHQVLSRLNPGQDIGAPLPTRIYLVRDRSSFVELGLASGADGVAGYFFSTSYGQFLVINADPRGAPLSTLFHEYLHHFVRTHLRFVPLWFNEGLAEYYSTFEVRDGVAVVGIEKARHLRTLGLERLLSLETLHRTDHRSSLYNEKRRRSIFYAQSWALVHLLLSDEYIEATQDFLGRLSRGEPADEALNAALAMSDLALEIELERYLASGRFEPFTFELAGDGLTTAAGDAMDPASAAVALGRLYLELQRSERARRVFDIALDQEPGNALALVGRGRLAAARGDDSSAVAWLEQAVAERSSSAEPDYFLGEVLLLRLRAEIRERGGPEGLDEEATKDLLRARAHLRNSLERDPSQPLARWRLGQSWHLAAPDAPGVAEGFEALGLAVGQLPWRDDVALDWIQLLARQRRFPQAQTALDSLFPPAATTEERAAGERVIALEKLNHGAWLVNNQKPEDGERVVRDVVDTAHLPGLRNEILPIAEEILGIAAHNRLVERYNRAVENVRRGQHARARELLRSVADETSDRRLRRLARSLLAEI